MSKRFNIFIPNRGVSVIEGNAEGGGRTHTPLRAKDFKSFVSAYSTTSALTTFAIVCRRIFRAGCASRPPSARKIISESLVDRDSILGVPAISAWRIFSDLAPRGKRTWFSVLGEFS